MGKSNDVSSTTTAEPWKKASSELNDIVDISQGMYQSGALAVDPYQGDRVAPLSAMTRSGIDAIGMLPSSLPAGTMEALQSNLNMGDTYRDFDRIREMVGDSTKAQLASTFAGGGINSGLAQDTYTRAIGDALAGVEYGAYDNAKARQMQAIGLAPGLATTQQQLAAQAAAGKLSGGGMQDAYNQSLIDADMQKWNETQMKDIDALQRYSSFVFPASGMGSATTTTSSGGGPGVSGVAGAAATGLGTYGALAAIPGIGAPLAIGGGILSALGSL